MEIDTQEGVSIRKLRHGGYIVCHPEIYNLGALWFAATTLDEAYAFIRSVMEPPATDSQTSG